MLVLASLWKISLNTERGTFFRIIVEGAVDVIFKH